MILGRRMLMLLSTRLQKIKSKTQGVGDGDSSDSSDGNAGSFFLSLTCTEIRGITFEVQGDCGRSAPFKGGCLNISAILGAVCGPLSGAFIVLNILQKRFIVGDRVSLNLFSLHETSLVIMTRFFQHTRFFLHSLLDKRLFPVGKCVSSSDCHTSRWAKSSFL